VDNPPAERAFNPVTDIDLVDDVNDVVDDIESEISNLRQSDEVQRLRAELDAIVRVATVQIGTSSTTVQVGSIRTLTAIALDTANNPVQGLAAVWSSNNAAVATVNSSGVVTGVAPGTAVISARIGLATGTISITVVALTDVYNYTSAVWLASSSNIKASVLSQLQQPGTGVGQSGDNAFWRVFDNTGAGWITDISETPLTLNRAFNLRLEQAKAPAGQSFNAKLQIRDGTNSFAYLETVINITDVAGEKITARALQNPSFEQVIFSNFDDIPQNQAVFVGGTIQSRINMPLELILSDFALEQSPASGSSSVVVGATTNLSVQAVEYIAGVRTPISRAATWSSSNAAVATVSSSGVVTGVSAGVAYVYAETAEVVAVFKITVTTPSGGGNFDLTMDGSTVVLVDYSQAPAPPTSDWSQYQSRQIVNPHRLFTDDLQIVDGAPVAMAGSRTMQTRIQRDQAAAYQNNWGLRARAENYVYLTCQYLRRYRFRWWFGLPTDWQALGVRVLVGQVHGVANVGSPPWSLILDGSQLRAQLRSSALAGYGGDLYGQAHANTPGTEDEWFVANLSSFLGTVRRIDVEWVPDYRQDRAVSQGVFKVAVDGVLIVNETGRPTAFNESSAGYPKFGFYSWEPTWWASAPLAATRTFWGPYKVTEQALS
jgi:uncharacterized protein YjdB